MKNIKKLKKGFTLVELVVVIAVIAILAAVSVGAYFGVTESAKKSQALQEGKAAHTNLVLIANDPSNKVCSLSDAGLTFEDEEAVVTALSTAAGVTYNWYEKDTDSTKEGVQVKYPAVDIDDTDLNKMTYYLDAEHSVSFVITTGAEWKANA